MSAGRPWAAVTRDCNPGFLHVEVKHLGMLADGLICLPEGDALELAALINDGPLPARRPERASVKYAGCPICGRSIASRLNGRLYVHNVSAEPGAARCPGRVKS